MPLLERDRFPRLDESGDEQDEREVLVVREEEEHNEENYLSAVEELYRSLERENRVLRRWVFGLGVLVVLLVVGLVVLVLTEKRGYDGVKAVGGGRRAVGLERSNVVFEKHELFASPSGREADEAWGSIMPPGDGFIYLPPSTPASSIPPGISSHSSSTNATIYDTTLFHQLHCLIHIRSFLSTLNLTMLSHGRPEDSTLVYDLLLAPQEDHVFHCFDYLRQGLMCAGDLTYEWPREEPDGRRFAVDGWGVEHECVSWDAIMRLMEENTVTRTVGRTD